MGIENLFTSAAKATIGTVLDGASKIITDFKADPTKAMEANIALEELKVNTAAKLAELSNTLEDTYAKEMESVNQTMQTESKSEHWMQWAWRPTIGFTFCAILLNNYILMPYFTALKAIVVPDNVFTAVLVILGAASAGRGLTQWQSAKNNTGK